MSKVYYIILLVSVLSVFSFNVVRVQTANFTNAGEFAESAATESGVDTGSSVEEKVASIVNYALSLLGVIFLILMVYGGFIWMLARGDEAEAKRAKNIITAGVIGMIIVIAAFAITTFVVNSLISTA